MKILIILVTSLIAGVMAEANPWNPRPGRGNYRRDADAAPKRSGRPGRPNYIREAEPEAWHPRYVYIFLYFLSYLNLLLVAYYIYEIEKENRCTNVRHGIHGQDAETTDAKPNLNLNPGILGSSSNLLRFCSARV